MGSEVRVDHRSVVASDIRGTRNIVYSSFYHHVTLEGEDERIGSSHTFRHSINSVQSIELGGCFLVLSLGP